MESKRYTFVHIRRPGEPLQRGDGIFRNSRKGYRLGQASRKAFAGKRHSQGDIARMTQAELDHWGYDKPKGFVDTRDMHKEQAPDMETIRKWMTR
jgi:hypothetical protein